jgi:hypothetical protein
VGAAAAVSAQTILVNYVDALKKAKYAQGAKSSFDATTNAVSKLLDRFKLFGACAAALKSALTVAGGGPKAAKVIKEILLSTQPAARLPPPSFPLPNAGQLRATRKRALATMQSSEPESTPDEDFVVPDNHTDSSSDSEEESQPGSGTAPDQVNLTDQDDDKDDDSDDEVTHFV